MSQPTDRAADAPTRADAGAAAEVAPELLLSRRRFLAGTVALAGAGALGASGVTLVGCAPSVPPTNPAANPNAWVALSTAGLVPGEPRWVEFAIPPASTSSSPPLPSSPPATPGGTPATLTAQRGGTWLVKQADGSVDAFVPSCTHQLCLYDWTATDRRFRCRCHDGTFDVHGTVLKGPPPRPLWRYVSRPAGTDTIEIGVVGTT